MIRRRVVPTLGLRLGVFFGSCGVIGAALALPPTTARNLLLVTLLLPALLEVLDLGLLAGWIARSLRRRDVARGRAPASIWYRDLDHDRQREQAHFFDASEDNPTIR